MNRFDRYIMRTVLLTAILSLCVLLALEVFFTFLTELEDVGDGGYGVAQLLRYLALSLPRMLYEIFPLALLLGGLLGMGGLAQTSELVVMRAAGISRLRLVGAAVAAGLLLSVISVGIGEYIAPGAEQRAQTFRAQARNQGLEVRGGRGFWAREGKTFIQVNAVRPGPELAEVFVFRLNDSGALSTMIYADRAEYRDEQWHLRDVSRSQIDATSVRSSIDADMVVPAVVSPELIRVLASEPDDLALRDLWQFIDYLDDNNLDTREYRLAFWSKVFGPLSNLTMLLVAMPFAFAHQRSGGVGQRLMIGIMIGLVFFLANRMLGNVVLLYGYPPALGAALPSMIFLGCGLFALKRMRG